MLGLGGQEGRPAAKGEIPGAAARADRRDGGRPGAGRGRDPGAVRHPGIVRRSAGAGTRPGAGFGMIEGVSRGRPAQRGFVAVRPQMTDVRVARLRSVSMAGDATCPACGAKLAGDAPQGLCPACLIRQGSQTPGKSDTRGVRHPPNSFGSSRGMPAVVTRAHAAGAGTIRAHPAAVDINSSAVLLGFNFEREHRLDWRMAFGALRDV
jgi:hypothetical protein